MIDPARFEALLDQLAYGSTNDPDAEWKAAIALADAQEPDQKQHAVSALVQVLTGGRAHALIRAHAVESLGRLGDRQAVPALIDALRDPYRLVRAYAAEALGKVGDPQAIDPLLAALEGDEFFGVRAEAAAAAAQLSVNQTGAVRQRVREALIRRREAETANPEPGSERVIAEIDRALPLLESGDEG